MSAPENRIRLDEAISIVKAHRPDRKKATSKLESALGLTLAEDIVAQTTLPPTDVSAMDGYAVKLDDVRSAGSIVKVIGEAPAGKRFDGTPSTGEAVQIFTGGVVPSGADHIVIQEMTERRGDEVVVTADQTHARHIRKAGQDFRAGELLLKKGRSLRPADLGMIAAANIANVEIYKAQRVAILPNGDELKVPGTALEIGQIINSNSYALSALCRKWMAEPDALEPARDTIESITSNFERSENADIIVLVGGASVGKYDVVKPALRSLGVEMLFDGILMRPGKPCWFGVWNNTPVLGLPGNPVAAYVGANLLLACLMGVFDKLRFHSATTSSELNENGDRERFSLAVLESTNGQSVVHTLSKKDTSLTTSLSKANCLLHRAAGASAVGSGGLVSVLPLD